MHVSLFDCIVGIKVWGEMLLSSYIRSILCKCDFSDDESSHWREKIMYLQLERKDYLITDNTISMVTRYIILSSLFHFHFEHSLSLSLRQDATSIATSIATLFHI